VPIQRLPARQRTELRSIDANIKKDADCRPLAALAKFTA